MIDQSRSKPIVIALLRLVIEGVTDPLDLGVSQRLTILRAQFGGDRTIGPLILEAWDALLRAQGQVDEAADRTYLNGLIDGTGDLLSESTFLTMEPMFAKYAEGSDMYVLLESASSAFSDAAQELACWVLAGHAIDVAKLSHPRAEE